MAAGKPAEKQVAPAGVAYVGFCHVRGSVDAERKEVPRMLNSISGLETTAVESERFGTGAVLPSGVRTAQPSCTGAVMPARSRAFWAADVLRPSRVAAGLDVALGQRNSGKPYPHTTRITAPSGDAKGPHPAREPV
jgi:hypothetical protein